MDNKRKSTSPYLKGSKVKILLIDAYNMIHRARAGRFPGEYGLIYTFFRSLRAEVDRHKPDRLYIVMEGKPVKRLERSPDYKGTRTSVADPGFYKQKDEIINLVRLFPITLARHPTHECDDVIAHIANKIHPNDEVIISSSDTDFLQVTSERVKLWNPVFKSFREPEFNYVRFKALKGDKSDNIKGIKGIGVKTAAKLASDEQSFDEFMRKKPEARVIYEHAEQMIRFEELDPIEQLSLQHFAYDSNRIAEDFHNRKFFSILDKGWKKWDETWTMLEQARCKEF
jgi:5'-3' exonuclease